MQTDAVKRARGFALFALGFRPFFLAAAIAAVLLMAATLAGYGWGGWGGYFNFVVWHGHEMLFGYTVAVIAGFLLTAVRNWTGLDTPSGVPLFGLVLLWLLGRLAPFVPVLSGPMVALIDLSFLPLLALVIGRRLWRAGQRRNLFVPLLLLLLALANGLVHAGALGFYEAAAGIGLQLAVNLVMLLIAVIAGRVIPFFTRSAIPQARVVSQPWLERFAIASLAAYVVVAIPLSTGPVPAVLAGLAACLHAWRLAGWHDPGIWRRPMLWVLFLGYGWLVIGLALQTFAALGWFPALPAMHALTAGGIGMLTLGMMARVAKGHTGRPIQAAAPLVVAFCLVLLAALLRTLVAALMPTWTFAAYAAAAACWIAAFAIFLWFYTPILLRPRIDGRPG